MFAFGAVFDGSFVFTQGRDGHTYTWPNEKVAREFYESVVDKYHLYEVSDDLSLVTLIQCSKSEVDAPTGFEPNEDQKLELFNSYVYPSLLAWSPPEEML